MGSRNERRLVNRLSLHRNSVIESRNQQVLFYADEAADLERFSRLLEICKSHLSISTQRHVTSKGDPDPLA